MQHTKEKRFAAILTLLGMVIAIGLVLIVGRYASDGLLAILAAVVVIVTFVAKEV